MKPVRKAVLPAAGFGTRFLPFTRAVPKEMIPLVDKPVIQYVVEEAAAAGIEEIREVPPDPHAAAEPAPGLRPQFSDVAGEESFGQYLKALRLRNNFTIDEIAEETKIRPDYLTALEAEDFGSLPQPVYVLGYVRKLCTLYHVDAKRADEITCGLRALLEYEIPEDISKSVIDHEISEENERKIRQLILIMVAAVVLVVLVLVAGGVLLLAGLRGASHPADSATAFNESRLIELQGTPKVDITELK